MRPLFLLLSMLAFVGCSAPADPEPLVSLLYRRDGKLILVRARVNGTEPAWLIVDSGASHSVLDDEFARRLGLAVTARSTTTGTGRGAVPVGHVGAVTLQLGGMEATLPDPWVVDLAGVPIPSDTAGLLGSELFRSHVVRIDPARRRFEVFDPGSFRHPPGGTAIPLIIDGDKLFVEATLTVRPGLAVRRRLRVDTGSESSISDPVVGRSPIVRRARLGQGLGEDYDALTGVLETVQLGPYRFRQVLGAGSSPSAIGMQLLHRFVLTFDAPHGRLHLDPGTGWKSGCRCSTEVLARRAGFPQEKVAF